MVQLGLFLNSDYGFMTTGEPYRSLAFQFRIQHRRIVVTVWQTLFAICEILEKVAILEPN
jgi:hypothetical protein